MLKILFRIPSFLINIMWFIGKQLARGICLVLKTFLFVFYPLWWFAKKLFLRKKTPVADFAIPIIDNEPEMPRKNKKSISKVGSLVPREEDHDLRSFTVMNSEGELFLIDTGAKGTFFGAAWTKILASYQEQTCVRGRIVRSYYDEFLQLQGFEIRINQIKAFLPLSESLRLQQQQPINTLLAVTQIFPETNIVVVSSRIAYQRTLGNTTPKQGDKAQMIYWDYDDDYIYCLLSANYMGICMREGLSMMRLEELMGKVGNVNIESISNEKREAQLTILDENDLYPSLENIPIPSLECTEL